eukprot:1182980-Prorocentrum_minimum.AAC.3
MSVSSPTGSEGVWRLVSRRALPFRLLYAVTKVAGGRDKSGGWPWQKRRVAKRCRRSLANQTYSGPADAV